MFNLRHVKLIIQILMTMCDLRHILKSILVIYATCLSCNLCHIKLDKKALYNLCDLVGTYKHFKRQISK
jgi:hypothetical protein